MKIKYLLILLVCIQQAIICQTMKIYKNDQSTIDFKLSEIDSIKISTSVNGLQLNTLDWNCISNNSTLSLTQGVYEKTDEGLKVFGNANYYNNPVQLIPSLDRSAMPKTIYLKWKAHSNSNRNNVYIGIELFSDSKLSASLGNILKLSTSQSANAANIIFNDVWYYTRISQVSGNIISTTSTGNYDTFGGRIISSSSLNTSMSANTFSFQTYADKSSYSILGESKLEF